MELFIFCLKYVIESFGFNAAIARLYAFTNSLAKSKASTQTKISAAKTLAQLMSPMTPHLSEELWDSVSYIQTVKGILIL